MDIITSMNKDLFYKFGRDNIKSLSDNLDKDFRLNVFFEGDVFNELKELENENVRIVKFESSDWQTFFRKFGHLKEANGYKFEESISGKEINLKIYGPDFRWNAVKFSFKIFSVILASEMKDISNKFFWLDADVNCLKKTSVKDIEKFLPLDDELMTYLGRDSFPADYPHTETGFLGFNKLHKSFHLYMNTLKNFYVTGEFFTLPRLHDCLIYDTAREIFETSKVKFRCLSGQYKSAEHPFIYCGLGEFFDHLKGPERKSQGFSKERLDKEICVV